MMLPWMSVTKMSSLSVLRDTRVNRRALRRDDVADAPPAVPAVSEVRFPRRGVDAAVRADDEDVQVVGAAGYRGDVGARRGPPLSRFHQPCQPSAKSGSHAAV